VYGWVIGTANGPYRGRRLRASQVKCSSGKDEQRSQDLLGTSGAGLAKDLPSTMCCGNILCEIIAARAETRRLQLAEQAVQDTRRQGYS